MGLTLLLKRLAAFVIDWGILFGILVLPQFILATVLDRWILSADAAPLAQWSWVALTVSIPGWIYFVASDSSASGATLGKRLFGLAARDVDGARISPWRALARNAVKLLPWEVTHIMIFFPEPFGDDLGPVKLALMIASNALLVAWLAVPLLGRPKHRALHDLVAHTRAVSRPQVAPG